MKAFYSKFHIGLLALGVGVAAVYFWSGMSVAWREVAVDLPEANADVLPVFPAVHEPKKMRYMCDDISDPADHSACIDEVIFSGRDLAAYKSGGVFGCNLERAKADSRQCEISNKNARSFVWTHWRQRQRAYVAVLRSSSESGREWTTHLFIEPNDEGKWRIVERTIPMLIPEDAGELRLGDLIEVEWQTATDWDEKWGRPKRGTRILRLTDLVGNSLIL